MKRTGLLTIVLSILFSGYCFSQEVKAKENKVKVDDEKVKMKSDQIKVKSDDAKAKTDDAMKVNTDAVMKMKNLPYTANYSSNFAIGNADYSKIILDMWKDWDDNMLGRTDHMADSLTMTFSDGTTMKGKVANLEAGKKYRGSMKSVKSTLHAWVPLRSIDRNEDVVCIWGEEENTMADGKIEKKGTHEVWFFNKDGKIYNMLQWTAAIK